MASFMSIFIYGGYVIRQLLTKFLDSMLRFSFTPSIMKKGVITVLHKGNNKPRNEPKSYRAITLSSELLMIIKDNQSTTCTVNNRQGVSAKAWDV